MISKSKERATGEGFEVKYDFGPKLQHMKFNQPFLCKQN